MTNRTQALVLGFGALMWVRLVVVLVGAPEVYAETFSRLPTDLHTAEPGFLALITVFMGLLAIGVLRRWRWTFWLLTVAFLGGALHVPAALVELTGVLPTVDPTW